MNKKEIDECYRKWRKLQHEIDNMVIQYDLDVSVDHTHKQLRLIEELDLLNKIIKTAVEIVVDHGTDHLKTDAKIQEEKESKDG